MLYLRLFFVYPDSGGDLQVHISSEYEEFQRFWENFQSQDGKTALVHIGFTRLNNDEIFQVFRKNPDKVIFTSSAVSILSDLLKIKTIYIERAFNEKFYALGGEGLDYINIPDPDVPAPDAPAQESESYPDWVVKGNSFNWFRDFEMHRADLAEMAIQFGIKDDLSYQLNESKLPAEIRVELAFGRYKFIKDVISLSRIKDIPRIFPPWILTKSIDIFDFSVRTRNRMGMQNIKNIYDFSFYTDEELLQIPGIGLNSLNEIRSSLSEYASLIAGDKNSLLRSMDSDDVRIFSALKTLNNAQENINDLQSIKNSDVYLSGGPLVSPQPISLLDTFKLCVSSLAGTQKTVIEHRSGLIDSPKTLQEVSEIIGTTRERVRQIQKKASEIIFKKSDLGIQIWKRLDEVRRGMVVPLKISSLGRYDSWFEGVDRQPHVFEFIIHIAHLLQTPKDGGYVVSSYKNLGIILKGGNDFLEKSIKDLNYYIKNNVNKGITKSNIREKIETIASIDARELVDFVFHEATQHAQFSTEGNELLIHYGDGIESQIIDALSNSDTPLNVSDIADHIRKKFNPLIEVGYVRNQCIVNFHLFARSTYGLRKHLLFSDSEIDEISEQARGHMKSLPSTRQWRSNEILDDIPELIEKYGNRINQYTLAIILSLSGKVTSHGKLLFSLSTDRDEGRSTRVEFLDLVEGVLEKSEIPLTRAAIYALVSKDRGLSSTAQIHQNGRIVSFGKGVWGLLDKHLGLTKIDFEIIIQELLNVFSKVQEGLDYEELVARLPESSKAWQLRNTPAVLFSLATKSKKFKVSDIFLYPAIWAEPFRITQKLALQHACDEIPMDGASLFDILDNASKKYGHPISRDVGYGLIRMMGAYHDESTGRWFKNK